MQPCNTLTKNTDWAKPWQRNTAQAIPWQGIQIQQYLDKENKEYWRRRRSWSNTLARNTGGVCRWGKPCQRQRDTWWSGSTRRWLEWWWGWSGWWLKWGGGWSGQFGYEWRWGSLEQVCETWLEFHILLVECPHTQNISWDKIFLKILVNKMLNIFPRLGDVDPFWPIQPKPHFISRPSESLQLFPQICRSAQIDTFFLLEKHTLNLSFNDQIKHLKDRLKLYFR